MSSRIRPNVSQRQYQQQQQQQQLSTTVASSSSPSRIRMDVDDVAAEEEGEEESEEVQGEYDGDDGLDIDTLQVRADPAYQNALHADDRQRLEGLVGPGADQRNKIPMACDRWFAHTQSSLSAYCYLCTVDPEDEPRFRGNEHRKTMESLVAMAESKDEYAICQAISAIYVKHVFPVTQREFPIESIRRHIIDHQQPKPLVLVRQNIKVTQTLMDYWRGRLMFEPESRDDPPEINPEAERRLCMLTKTMENNAKFLAQLESRRR